MFSLSIKADSRLFAESYAATETLLVTAFC